MDNRIEEIVRAGWAIQISFYNQYHIELYNDETDDTYNFGDDDYEIALDKAFICFIANKQ